MPRTVPLTATSPHPPESIRAAFADPDYWTARLELYTAGAPTLDAFTTDSRGVTVVGITVRFGGEQMPAVLRPLRSGPLRVVQRERWEPTGGGVRGDIAVEALRTPLSGHGDVHLASSGTGTGLTGTAVVDVRVPLIGGPIAAFLVELLGQGIRDIVAVTDRWLDAHPR